MPKLVDKKVKIVVMGNFWQSINVIKCGKFEDNEGIGNRFI